MRFSTSHVISAAASVVAVAALLGAGPQPFVGSDSGSLEAGLLDPRDMVVVREGNPLVVPANKVFVLTALGGTRGPSSCSSAYSLLVDGVLQMKSIDYSGSSPYGGVTSTTSMQPLFLTARGPCAVSVAVDYSSIGCTVEARAWGFMVNEASNPAWIQVPQRDPRDIMTIEQGAPLVVPHGKLFILTGLGDNPGAGYYSNEPEVARLFVDGTLELETAYGAPHGNFKPVPSGFVARGGSSIEVATDAGRAPARAWGYFLDEKRTVRAR